MLMSSPSSSSPSSSPLYWCHVCAREVRAVAVEATGDGRVARGAEGSSGGEGDDSGAPPPPPSRAPHPRPQLLCVHCQQPYIEERTEEGQAGAAALTPPAPAAPPPPPLPQAVVRPLPPPPLPAGGSFTFAPAFPFPFPLLPPFPLSAPLLSFPHLAPPLPSPPPGGAGLTPLPPFQSHLGDAFHSSPGDYALSAEHFNQLLASLLHHPQHPPHARPAGDGPTPPSVLAQLRRIPLAQPAPPSPPSPQAAAAVEAEHCEPPRRAPPPVASPASFPPCPICQCDVQWGDRLLQMSLSCGHSSAIHRCTTAAPIPPLPSFSSVPHLTPLRVLCCAASTRSASYRGCSRAADAPPAEAASHSPHCHHR